MKNKLADRVGAEMELFMKEVMTKTKAEIVEMAFEISIKKEIALVLSDDRTANAEYGRYFSGLASPVNLVYEEYLNLDTGEDFRNTVEEIMYDILTTDAGGE